MEKTSSVETVAQDRLCFRCGYDLRGLARDGRCPECGEAVELSQAGRHLGASDPRWRRRLRLGAGLHASGLIGFLVIVLHRANGHVAGVARMLDYVLMVAAVLLGAAGAWLATSSEPGGPYFDDARWLRRLVRGLAALSLSGMAGYARIQMADWSNSFGEMVFWQNITGTMAFGGSLLATGLAIWHLSRLAKRMNAGRLVFYGRLSALSPAIMVAALYGVAFLLSYLRVPAYSLWWLMLMLCFTLFLWPAAYQLVWCYRVGVVSGRTS